MLLLDGQFALYCLYSYLQLQKYHINDQNNWYGDEGEGTLKRYIQRGNCVVLQPFNPAYHEMVIRGEDLNHLHIAGRVVETKAKW